MSKRVALMLPGQGSQYVGMGAELAAVDPTIHRLYEEADDVLTFSLSRVCHEGPEDELCHTENAQPAILVHSYAVWLSLPARIRSSVVVAAGHSLGEFSAWLAAGSLSFADALRTVRRRGELMAAAGRERPGTMAAVLGLDSEVIADLCSGVREGICVPANFNASGQVVISGDGRGVGAASLAALEAGARKVVPLSVSGAFHSPLMGTARDGLQAALSDIKMADPAFPVVTNASAAPVSDAMTGRALLIEQLTSPVRWVESIGAMESFEPDLWIELGPGAVLTGLLRRIERRRPVTTAGSPEEIETLVEAFDD
ncbi:MAG: ACP S-malonyltransferase [Gemmatimonadales bacterium]|nr:MAG: ACP S-malonyltransferase [Gemmatimonadales bacterium]